MNDLPNHRPFIDLTDFADPLTTDDPPRAGLGGGVSEDPRRAEEPLLQGVPGRDEAGAIGGSVTEHVGDSARCERELGVG